MNLLDLLQQKDLPLVMGILNATPDSFSDGGSYLSEGELQHHIDQMVHDGADMIDIGGESTRPYAEPVTAEEELRRVLPAIKAVRKKHPIPISIDTTKAEVAAQALQAGADIINDISACRFDPDMVKVVDRFQVPIIIMHMQGTPQDMQKQPHYKDVIIEISDFFRGRIAWLADSGISKDRIIIDPGIGFGKTVAHNLSIIKHLQDFSSIGCSLLVGYSRKSFIGKILDLEVHERDNASAIISTICAMQGAHILRVHDVKKTVAGLRLLQAIQSAT